MSSDAVAWVFDNSPYRGALFALHLALADVANKPNNYEVWKSAPHLAERARVSERTVRDGLATLVADGALEELSRRNGATTRYRLLLTNPCSQFTPAASSPLQPTAPTPATDREIPPPTPAASSKTPAVAAPELKNSTEMNSRGTQPATLVGFDAFWRVYPLHVGERHARKAWHQAIRRAVPADILIGAQRYTDDPTRDDRYTLSPAKWLEGDHWKDERKTRREAPATGTARRLIERQGGSLKELTA